LSRTSALRYLRSTLQRQCRGCEVVATAENGTEGLDKVRQLRPDLLITDIRMAGMDGIELTERVKREFPEIYSVIVSGYQDFDYARGALHSGVVDYLLKPVRAVELQAVVEKVGLRVRRQLYEQRVEVLRRVAAGTPVGEEKLRRLLPYDRLWAAVLRFGGLPSRFGATGSDEPAAADGAELREAGVWAASGRDARETMFFCAEEVTTGSRFQRVIAGARQRGHGFSTLVLGGAAFPLSDCLRHVAELRHALDGLIVPGLSQTLVLDASLPAGQRGPDPARGAPGAILDPARESRIDFLLCNGGGAGLEQELRDHASEWERHRRPLVAVEAALRQTLHKVVRASGNPAGMPPDEMEFLLDSLLSRASSYAELGSGAWDIVREILGTGHAARRDGDAPSLHSTIVRYVEQNLAEPLTLQSVCDRFRVSQTYVSRLFRRFEGASFIEFLTRRRVVAAQRLIRDHPEMPLKDVAAYVGYRDQFYFSRVFKSVTGVPPSEWG